jgi:hypothetical protein
MSFLMAENNVYTYDFYLGTVVQLRNITIAPLSYLYTANLSFGMNNPLLWSQQIQ